MQATLFGKVRQFTADVLGAGTSQSAMNGRGDLCVAQSLPAKTEYVRLGGTWSARIPLASHFSTVAAQPTTRAELVLFNGEPAGGKSYLIESVEFLADVTQAVATQIALLGQIVPNIGLAVAAPTDNAAILRNSRSGRGTFSSNAKLALANTAFAIADRWEVLGSAISGAAGSIGLAAYAEVYGGFIIPPQAVFCINAIVGTAAAASATMGICWDEVQLDRTP